MKLLKCLFTQNRCYTQGVKITPKGIMVHSTGANNPNLKRYVQPSTNDVNYNILISQLGKNNGGNAWNNANTDVCVHAFIGKLANGEIATVQTLPWNYKGWHCGTGTKGTSANNTHISFEICEDALTDATYFNKVYKEAVEFCAYLCELYKFDPLKDGVIIGHYEGYQRGVASNHADPRNWFPRFNKSMDTFRQDVATKMGKVVTPVENKETTVSYTGVVNTASLRIRKGPSTTTSMVGSLKKGQTVQIILESDGWGKLADGSGWVSLTYITKNSSTSTTSTTTETFKEYQGKITATSGVNIRTGAGTGYNKNGAVAYNTIVKIVEEKKVSGVTWGRLGDGRGWISLAYLKKI